MRSSSDVLPSVTGGWSSPTSSTGGSGGLGFAAAAGGLVAGLAGPLADAGLSTRFCIRIPRLTRGQGTNRTSLARRSDLTGSCDSATLHHHAASERFPAARKTRIVAGKRRRRQRD